MAAGRAQPANPFSRQDNIMSFTSLIRAIFGSSNSRQLKRLKRIVTKINAYEGAYAALADADLQAKTAEFRQRFWWQFFCK